MFEKTLARTLKHEALTSCLVRGHSMKRFEKTDSGVFYAECKDCYMWVQVDLHPSPNGIDIGGPAIVLDCTGNIQK